MTRPSDTIKEPRSYAVYRDPVRGIIVKGSHWAPGYTPQYCETPEEAIDRAIAKAEEAMNLAQAHVVELYDYKATMMDEDR